MLLLLVLACTSATDSADEDTDPAVDPGPASVLGDEGGAFEWTPILTDGNRLSDPRDLGFDTAGRLWVANREDDRTFIVVDPGTDDAQVERRRDGYAEHFMEETAAFSFEGLSGEGKYGPEFGSCGESENTYNGMAPPNEFMGPVLWTTMLDVFAEEDPLGLGSHLDMLHQSPLCVGIAWEKDNVYWVFDGFHDRIVRNDFLADHDIGQDDHSDGVIYQYSEPEVKRVENAPGHMAFDHQSGMLYVADTGNDRILRIDTATGSQGKKLRQGDEPIDTYAAWDDVEWEEVVTDLDKPGGLALHEGTLIVGEWGTGMLYAYTLDGERIGSLDTEVGDEALYGIEVGPDGKLWITETATPAVLRLDIL